VSPLRAENLKIGLLNTGELNNWRFALRAMLTVNRTASMEVKKLQFVHTSTATRNE